MNNRIHRWLLGLMLLLLAPGTALACLLLFGATASGFSDGFEANYLPAVVILLIAPALVWWGVRLMSGLREGVHASIRRKLLAFYLAVFVYCWLWLTTSHSDRAIFSPGEQLAGLGILIMPVLITLFTKPEKKHVGTPLVGGLHPLNRTSRFVAWLASRVR